MSSNDSAIRDHQAWLGYLQPDGLVVSPAALVDAQALLDKSNIDLQERFKAFGTPIGEKEKTTDVVVVDTIGFLTGFLKWPEKLIYGAAAERPVPDDLRVVLPEFGETLAPTYAIRDPKAKEGQSPWLMLVANLTLGTKLDDPVQIEGSKWSVSPSRRFERLLRETGIPIGLIANGTSFRLVYAPRGENVGTITFPLGPMSQIAGRPILGAFNLLLDDNCLFAAPTDRRLPSILARSREYQSRVSTTLAGQVLDALYDLLRGFQSADDKTHGKLLADVLGRNPDEVYGGLLNTLLRLVFVLFAEDRGLMPGSGVYLKHYAIHGLFERLRADNEQFPDTMESRYGAWAQLLVLFRAIHGGCDHGDLQMPARHGYLFDPNRYKFLEGRDAEGPALPLISDGVVYRVLERLLILDGERLSYRTLDVEQIGSVYETMMGFRLEVASGATIAVKPIKSHGAPSAINVSELLSQNPGDRVKWLTERTDQKLGTSEADQIKSAKEIDDVLAALDRKIARNATPSVVPRGAMVLQPSDARRRSGSHYTPRSLTAPIVRKTLKPLLDKLGENPTPQQLLELKISDIAVGSGAFLVETDRQLGDELVKAWHAHACVPEVPPDEDIVLLARRTVAQACLYGVDRNPMAVDLAKLSLWLATLAKDHPFTFLDHAIRCGDSLVGLTRRQIETFTWKAGSAIGQLWEPEVRKRTAAALQERQHLLRLGDDSIAPQIKSEKLKKSDELLDVVRLLGDAAVLAFFSGETDRDRENKRTEMAERIASFVASTDASDCIRGEIGAVYSGEFPLNPFHWEIEFPEVFNRSNPGFDAIVGNPPFAGKNTLINGNREGYLEWLQEANEGSHGNSDLVAHFFRRAFGLLRSNGCFGLIATNTIGQGDTRVSGLSWICRNGGTIYSARKRYKWPGQAAVVVSVVCIAKGIVAAPYDLDGRKVDLITAYLFHAGGHESPATLQANRGRSFIGSYVLGMGFTFDDKDAKGVASPISEMHRLTKKDRKNAERIFPFLGGEEVNESPTHSHNRYVINFGELSESEARAWPDLINIVEKKVRPEREAQAREIRKRYWWRFGETTPALFAAMRGKKKVLVQSQVSSFVAMAFVDAKQVFSHGLDLFIFEDLAPFACLQSRVHEGWARFFGSSLEDRLRYTPSDCFETFPFPENFETNAHLETAGREYYDYRAKLMLKNNEGMTKTYNRFHDPEEASAEIVKLRELHAAMDLAVLRAYTWTDLIPQCSCEFLLEYEDDAGAEGEEASNRRKKKPWRYRWSDKVKDEVLARLLDLNKTRHREEFEAGKHTSTRGKKGNAPGRVTSTAFSVQSELIPSPQGDLFAK